MVDDDARIRDLLRRYLTQEGLEVILAEDGKALNRILLRDTVDLIVLDPHDPRDPILANLAHRLRDARPTRRTRRLPTPSKTRSTRQAFIRAGFCVGGHGTFFARTSSLPTGR